MGSPGLDRAASDRTMDTFDGEKSKEKVVRLADLGSSPSPSPPDSCRLQISTCNT